MEDLPTDTENPVGLIEEGYRQFRIKAGDLICEVYSNQQVNFECHGKILSMRDLAKVRFTSLGIILRTYKMEIRTKEKLFRIQVGYGTLYKSLDVLLLYVEVCSGQTRPDLFLRLDDF